MDAGGVEVQHQPSNQDPTRQSWRGSNSSNGDSGKRRENSTGLGKFKSVNLKSINVERAQSLIQQGARTATLPSVKEYSTIKTPKSAVFQRLGQQQQHQQQQQQQQQQQPIYVMSPASAAFQHMNFSRSTPDLLSRSSPPQSVNVPRHSPPQTIATSLSRSPPKTASAVGNVNGGSTNGSTKRANGSSRPTPKPLNLTKSTQVQNFGRVPQTATFPPKVNRALNLPQPPKTATFPKASSGFPKDIRQARPVTSFSQPAYAVVYGDQTYIQPMESPRLRRYSATPAPLRFASPSYRHVEMGPGTPVVVLSHPDDSDSAGSSPPTPGLLPPEGFAGTDIYDLYTIPQYHQDELEDPYYYEFYDYPNELIPPQTPTGTTYARSVTVPVPSKEQRRRSVLGGTKIHPDAVMPVRQPKGPDVSKNFPTRIRRKAVSKLYAAAAERRSKSAADRRKSAMF